MAKYYLNALTNYIVYIELLAKIIKHKLHTVIYYTFFRVDIAENIE